MTAEPGTDLVPAGDVGQAQETEPMIAGTFAVYQADDGGFVLVTDVAGRGVERRSISGRVIRMVTSGPLARTFSGIFGGV